MDNLTIASNEVTEMVLGLNRLARNLWWTWNQEAQEVFQELSPRGWQNLYHNAVAILHEVSEYELRVRLQDHEFASRVREVIHKFDAYISERHTWAAEHAPKLARNPVAYFSAEFGFHESLPIAAGGLGVLAGDHAKAASDLGLGFIGISLFYREGYFQQTINQENWQVDYYTLLNPRNLAIEPVLGPSGEPLVCSVEIAMSTVYFQAWRINVGRCPVYLIDSNRPENEQRFRDLTLRVYGGDSTTRIMQEILLGIGGVRLMRALGVEPSVFHMNEGHAAFLVFELLREKLAAGQKFAAALETTKKECIFTTHTPVEAGHDRFTPDLMSFVLMKMQQQLKLTPEVFLGLGRVDPKSQTEPFCMTVLALKGSRAANGVSELHGQVSRHMWQSLFPGVPVEKVPIGYITNGIHLLGWMKGPVRRFWRRKLTKLKARESKEGNDTTHFWKAGNGDWENEINQQEFWDRMTDPNFVTDEPPSVARAAPDAGRLHRL
jgi:starch phosphorylase